MPVRDILETDRVWSAFALADLSPELSPHCEWIVNDRANTLALLFRGFSPPFLFTIGDLAESFQLARHSAEPAFYASLPDGLLSHFAANNWEICDPKRMLRMVHRGAPPTRLPDAVRLGLSDVPELLNLYADGDSTGERPPFFHPRMLDSGVYFGIWEEGRLTAAAGTPVHAPDFQVSCIGNVYTRRDRRGRGLASICTGALTAELAAIGISTIALNVRTDNAPALRCYDRLGFVRHCEYDEVLLKRPTPTAPGTTSADSSASR